MATKREKPAEADAIIEAHKQALAGGLSAAELKILQHYADTLDLSEAAKRAGYSNFMASQAKHWLDPMRKEYRERFAKAFEARQQSIASATGLHVYDLVHELRSVVFTDPLDLYERDGSIRDLHDIPKSARMAIAEIDRSVTTTESGDRIERVKIKLRDKDGAIEKLMKHLGGYERDNQQKAANYVVLPVPVPVAAKPATIDITPNSSATPAMKNRATLEATNEWIVANDLEDPIIIGPEKKE